MPPRRKQTKRLTTLEVIHRQRTVEFPLCWEKVSLKQFNAFYQAQTVRATLEAFASDIDVLHTLGPAEKVRILARLSFREEVPDFASIPVPAHAHGIELASIGGGTLLQKWLLDRWLTELSGEVFNFVTASVPLLSIYLYPSLTGQPLTNLSQAQQSDIIDRVEALPCLYALPLVSYLFDRYANPVSTSETVYQINDAPNPVPEPHLPWYRRWLTCLNRKLTHTQTSEPQ